jgi:hypothetical protein
MLPIGLRVAGISRHRASAAGISFIAGGVTPSTGGSAYTITLNTTGANLLVVVATGEFTGTTFTDTYNNTWENLTNYNTGTLGAVQIYYAYDAIVGTGHEFVGSGSRPVLGVLAFSGALNTSAVYETGTDAGSNGSGGFNSTLQPGNCTPENIGDVIITGLSGQSNGDGALTLNDGFTLFQNNDGNYGTSGWACGIGYLIVSGTSPVNPTWGGISSDFYSAANIAAFAVA